MGSRRDARDSAFAILRNGDRILLVRTRKGKWLLPGGRLERGETHWEALRREVREETGLHAEVRGLTGIYSREDGSRAVVFAAAVLGSKRLPGARHEIREQRWVGVREARRLLSGTKRRRLRDALASPRAFEERRRKVRVRRWRAALG